MSSDVEYYLKAITDDKGNKALGEEMLKRQNSQHKELQIIGYFPSRTLKSNLIDTSAQTIDYYFCLCSS